MVLTGNLCYNEANPIAISQEGAIPLLVNLIDTGTEIAREEAVRTLGNLAFNLENKQAITEAGALPKLVDILCHGGPALRLESIIALGK